MRAWAALGAAIRLTPVVRPGVERAVETVYAAGEEVTELLEYTLESAKGGTDR